MPSYAPAQIYPEDLTYLIIHVLPRHAEELLDEADLDDAGQCNVIGKYRLAVHDEGDGLETARNMALEIFHAHDLISDPDDYHLMVSTYNATMDVHLMADLGVWCPISERPRAFTHLERGETGHITAQMQQYA